MENFKFPLQSRVVWAGIIGFLASALQLMGVTDFLVSGEEQTVVVDVVLQGIGLIAAVWAIYGRFKAKTALVVSSKPSIKIL